MKQKQLTLLNKIKNKTLFSCFIFTLHPLLLYLIIMIIYFLLFMYFFADPILCQGLEENTTSIGTSHSQAQTSTYLPTVQQQAIQARLESLE
jgi:hypothetical protein